MYEKFYKIARPNGWDFPTGQTNNYRDSIGKIIRRPDEGETHIAPPTFIYASRDANKAFIGGRIPCSLYLVEGTPVEDCGDRCAFKEVRVLCELDPASVFEWRYEEACSPVNPFKIEPPKITGVHLELLRQWSSIRKAVSETFKYAVWGTIENEVRHLVCISVVDAIGSVALEAVVDSVFDEVNPPLDAAWAYVGYIFTPIVKRWKYIVQRGKYPFYPAVELWHMGLVPKRVDDRWQLHGGEPAKILWEGKI